MCVTDRHDMTLAVKVALNPIQQTNHCNFHSARSKVKVKRAWEVVSDPCLLVGDVLHGPVRYENALVPLLLDCDSNENDTRTIVLDAIWKCQRQKIYRKLEPFFHGIIYGIIYYQYDILLFVIF